MWAALSAKSIQTSEASRGSGRVYQLPTAFHSVPEYSGGNRRRYNFTAFQRHHRPAPANSRFPTPIGSKPRPVPTDHGGGLDDRQCVARGRQLSKQSDEYQPIDAAEAWSLWGRPPQDVDLLA